ncbi:Hypothetical protein D9617_6g094990 [Elsinoe fawcettii]|nr:Hypothetical protein D9617_6g094990 [Elsinoe fawcettii]
MPSIDHGWPGEAEYGGGITGFLGSAIFLLVAILAYFEVLNAPHDTCCAYTVSNTTTSTGSMVVTVSPDLSQCTHHHQNHSSLLARDKAISLTPVADPVPLIAVADKSLATVDIIPVSTPLAPVTASVPQKSITLLPKKHHFLPHLQQLAFVSAMINLLASLLYFPSTILALPPLVKHLSPHTIRYGNWLVQAISSFGMWLSSLLLVREVQTRWWVPAWGIVGWWISSLNVAGGFGFLVSGILGFVAFPEVDGWLYWASMLGNLIGCWAFLVASVLQWYEATEKFPVVDLR